MHCTLSWTFLPEYATEIPEVRLISSDEEVLKIGGGRYASRAEGGQGDRYD